LTVLGDGPERMRWEKLADKLGLNELVDWAGRLPLKEAQRKMAEADVFVLTSVKEGTPTVMMEALSCGLPVICHDACGMAPVIDQICGIKVPMVKPDRSAAGFGQAIQRFIDTPELVQELSVGALNCKECFSWANNVGRMAQVYEDLL
jgi:glycosyltransferase involved in cell wall biosynthesis